MRLIDADALELEGWYLSRNYRVDSRTMCFETKDIKKVPTAQPENARINARKTHACDCINRQAAIDKVDRIVKVNHLNPDMVWFTPNGVKTLMEDLPSAEPEVTEEEVKEYCRKRCLCIVDSALLKKYASAQREIITCKECKYKDENCRRACTGWLPCMEARTGGDWYCGSAKRGEQDE